MRPPTIRSATPSDKDILGHLGAMLVTEHHDFDPLRFIAAGPDLAGRYGDFLSHQTSDPDKFVLVAERDGEVAGYVFAGAEGTDYMMLRGRAGAVYDLVVDPDHRRQRIGSLLLDAALDELRHRGMPRAVLFTADKNHSAQALFASARFRRTMVEMTCEL